jgi:hypothetical protein
MNHKVLVNENRENPEPESHPTIKHVTPTNGILNSFVRVFRGFR